MLKRKKIYYIPGIISLAILPIAFVYFANREMKARTFTVLPISMADTNLLIKYPGLFKRDNGHFPPLRNYTDIALTGDNIEDRSSLKFAQVKIREILSKNDTMNGVYFKFAVNSQFWTFIKTLDILKMEGARTFMPIDNNIWFYYFAPDTVWAPHFSTLQK